MNCDELSLYMTLDITWTVYTTPPMWFFAREQHARTIVQQVIDASSRMRSSAAGIITSGEMKTNSQQ
jgi:hypothetical protein